MGVQVRSLVASYIETGSGSQADAGALQSTIPLPSAPLAGQSCQCSIQDPVGAIKSEKTAMYPNYNHTHVEGNPFFLVMKVVYDAILTRSGGGEFVAFTKMATLI